MLKFEDKFDIGQKIRAYDFQPSPDRPSIYVEGIITDSGYFPGYGFSAYEIDVTLDAGSHAEDAPNRAGNTIYVPFEVSMCEYDGRIELLDA